MPPLRKSRQILFVATAVTLTACGNAPVKPEVETTVVVEPEPVVVAPPKPEPKPEPVAEVMAIGQPDAAFSMEQLSRTAPAQQGMQIEHIEFDPKQSSQAPEEPADAPLGMGKKPANAEALKALVAQKSQAAKAPEPAPANKVDVERKLRFARMMLMTKSGRRISESNNQEAKVILKDVRNKLDLVDQQIKANDHVAANETLGEALRLFNTASQMVPSEDLKAKQQEAYPNLKEELVVSRDLHHRNYEKIIAQHGLKAGVNYDRKRVVELEKQAEQQAALGDYAKANESLSLARDMIQAAIRQMMSGRKIVYELNIDTPEGEFQHELNRYLGYEELIPIAIEQKKPSQGIQMLAMRHVNEAKRMADVARKKAAEGDYPKAIRMIMDATAEIRKALKLMGVPNIG